MSGRAKRAVAGHHLPFGLGWQYTKLTKDDKNELPSTLSNYNIFMIICISPGRPPFGFVRLILTGLIQHIAA